MCRSPAAWAYSQRLDGLQRGEEPLADGLQLVVIEGEQIQVLQVLERVHPQAVDLVGIEEAASTREVGDPLTLVISCGPRAEAGTGLQSSLALLAAGPLLLSRERGTRLPVATDTEKMPGHGCGHARAPRPLCRALPPSGDSPQARARRKAGDGAHVRGFLL